jgi:transposase
MAFTSFVQSRLLLLGLNGSFLAYHLLKRAAPIFFLPTYSPELNIIEILWRFIKYSWLEIDAYESWISLVNAVENIIMKFGSEYIINFA